MRILNPIFFHIFLFSHLIAYGNGRFDAAINIIKNNRTLLKQSLKPDDFDNKIIDRICVATTDSTKKEALSRYFVCIRQFSSSITGNSAISDTMHFNFLLSLLNCGDSDMELSAFSYLQKYTLFETLKANSALLKDKIYKAKTINNYSKYTLITLLNPTNAEIDTMRNFKGDVYAMNAAFDSSALDTLINRYHSKDYSIHKRTIASQLLQTGVKKAVQVVLRDFYLPPYDITTYTTCAKCTSGTYQQDIIIELRRYHKISPILNVRLDSASYTLYKRDTASLVIAKEYWRDFSKWVKTNYNVDIPAELPFTTMFRGCYPTFSPRPNCPD